MSWICSVLTECRFRYFVPVNFICSLSGLTHFVRVVRPQIRSNLTKLRFVVLILPGFNKKRGTQLSSSFLLNWGTLPKKTIKYCFLRGGFEESFRNKKDSLSRVFFKLGRKDSNLRDGWTKTSCLTTWRRPIACVLL